MTYTPKPGDRVTSPLLVGEWDVTSVDRFDGNRCRLNKGTVTVNIDPADLTPVPTEPVPTLVRTVAEELAYQFQCGGAPADDYMEAAEAVVRVVDDWRNNA